MSSMQVSRENLIGLSRNSIAVGSLSFSLASRLLPSRLRDAVVMLYFWCRHCDDLADKLNLNAGPDTRNALIDRMIRKTRDPSESQDTDDLPFHAMKFVCAEYEIPDEYPLELLEGMRSDLFHQPIVDEKQLLLYCYRVAGTVGLMFAHIAGVSNSGALKMAARLGMAMQLTNIARDIVDDFKLGRCYLPAQWLEEESLSNGNFAELTRRSELSRVAVRLLNKAETYYRDGDLGLKFLSLRVAFAVCAARLIYSEIGRIVERKGAHAWDQRCWVPLSRKLVLVGKAGIFVVQLIPGRLMMPFRRVSKMTVLKFETLIG
jgi:phytoene synthase